MARKSKRSARSGARRPQKASPGSVRVTARRGFRVTVTPVRERAPARATARRAASVAPASAARDALIAALAQQELVATQEFSVAPAGSAPKRSARRGAAAARTEVAAVDVDVAPTESAVVLVEQNGEFSWHFPEPAPASPRGGARRSAAVSTTRRAPSQVTIPIRLNAPIAGAQPARRGIGVGSIASAAKGVVLKFVARAATGVALKFLERNVRKGLIVMDGDDPTAWRRIGHIGELSLSTDGPLRVLLWVHGTFSSTAGSFGALTSTSEGRDFLKRAREQYDAVIGFDHSTLAEDPHENAVDLVERLGRFARPMKIDAVTYSRGGLVFRSMVEQLLPASTARPELGSAVFVAVPNAGTLLAKPDNWHLLIDLYTNLAVGAFELLKLLPAAAPAAGILSELISGLGALVKYLADVVVTERRVPGLAAQEPGGDFVRALNETNEGEPLPATTRYLAITSDFDSKAAADGGKRTGLAGSFLGRLANGFIDRLMKEPNDLVVNDASMKRIDPSAGDFVKAALDFGDSPSVYHTVYFAQPRVAQQLATWLLDTATRHELAARRGLVSLRPSPKSTFERIRYHAPSPTGGGITASLSGAAPARRSTRRRGMAGTRRAAAAPTAAEPAWPASMSVEDVAQHYLDVFGVAPTTPVSTAGTRSSARRSRGPAMRAMAGVAREAAVAPVTSPTLVHHRTQVSPLTKDASVHIVSFTQTHDEIPIFGANAVVELDDSKKLVAAHAKLARVGDVTPTPTLSANDAFAKLLEFVQEDGAVAARKTRESKPALNFFQDSETGKWHLVYVFTDVPALPATWRVAQRPSARRPRRDGHGIGPGPRLRFPRLDYLVDAHDGSVVYYYSVTPTAANRARAGGRKSATRKAATKRKKVLKALPGSLRGVDDENQSQRFDGLQGAGGFQLVDPQRAIRTLDLEGGDIDNLPSKLPAPVTCSVFDFGTTNPAAVSAHVNSSRVFQFYNDVLIRRGVDDQGTELVNVVNCISTQDQPAPDWDNAVWWKGKMWYGRRSEDKKHGKFRSYARYLDIIAHELTHGVTETTSNLVYRDQAGALNESFSDIFGVIINNWVRLGADSDPRTWKWEIGPGLGEKAGKPLRNMKDPRVTGDPDHMDLYQNLPPDDDFGGVHTNSNIHNKAAYNLLTKTNGKKALVLPPREVARLYYFTLQRLDRVATFTDVLETMLDVAKTVYPDPDEAAPKMAAIRKAYADVGIGKDR